MLQEFFLKNSDHTFFELRNYCGHRKKNTKQPLDNLHMIDELGDETKITSFDMFCPDCDDDLVKKVCPSLLEWANYLLEPYEDIENKEKSKFKSDNYQSGPMQSYNITDDAIKWKCEIPSGTTPSAESTPILNMEELSKFDFDVKNYENPPLINNVTEALEECHSRYAKLKKKNYQQKDEHDMVNWKLHRSCKCTAITHRNKKLL
jgi:hypothetical protein